MVKQLLVRHLQWLEEDLINNYHKKLNRRKSLPYQVFRMIYNKKDIILSV